MDRSATVLPADALRARAARCVALLVITHDPALAGDTLDPALVLEHGRRAMDAGLAGVLADEVQLARVGLVPPPLAGLSAALELPERPIRTREVAAALVKRC